MDVGLVCDSCSTLNPMDSTTCSRCGTSVSLGADPGANALGAAATPQTAQHAAAGGKACAACSAPIPPGFKFCGACGTPVVEAASIPYDTGATAPSDFHHEETRARAPASSSSSGGGGKKTMFFSTMQATRAKLVLIKGDGLDGVSFTLAGDDHVAGRGDEAALLFDEDPFLSPIHANFFYRDGGLVVRDEESVNGIYLRIRGSHDIEMGDRFLVGEQLLEVQAAGADLDTPAPDGTYFFASLHRPAPFRITQQLRGGDSGLAVRPTADVVTLGREGNDINFPDDPFISGHHAQVSQAGSRLVLTDLNSKNGTFLRIRGEQVLAHGDYVFMGQQLLRVEIV